MAEEFKGKMNVAVLAAGPAEEEHDALLHKALLIEKELAKVANVSILDVAMMPNVSMKEALGILEDSFQVILTLTSNQNSGQTRISKLRQQKAMNKLSSLCRWNVSGIDVWVEATRCNQAVYNALKGVGDEGFGRFDLLGPLKSAKRMDIQETAVPSIYP